ncbi:MAG: tetratricopeptide repeat protein [Candidatus Hodarchaeota archaeon]
MSGNELKQVEHLLIRGQYEEAKQIIENWEKINLTLDDRLTYYHLKSILLFKQGQLEEALNLAQHLYQESWMMKKPLRALDACITMVETLRKLGKFRECLDVIKKSEDMIKQLDYDQAPEIIEKRGSLLHNKGIVFVKKGELDQALKYHQQSLTLKRKIDNKRGIASSLVNIAIVYQQKGELDQALKYFKENLRIFEDIGNNQDIAGILNNIGIVYVEKGEIKQALEYYKKSFALFEIHGTKNQIAMSLNNLGSLYIRQGSLNEALDCHRRCLAIDEEIGNRQNIANSLYSIGRICLQRGEIHRALEYFERCLDLLEDFDNKNLSARCFLSIGTIYREKNNFNRALEFLEKGLALFEEFGNKIYLANALFHLISVIIDQTSLEEVDLATERKKLEQAVVYLDRLREIQLTEANKYVNQLYRVATALMLRFSDEEAKQTEAQNIYLQIIQEEIISYELTILCMLNLSRTLFEKFITSGKKSILIELRSYLTKILTIAKQKHLQGIKLAVIFLQGKLELLGLNIPEARALLQEVNVESQIRGYSWLKLLCENELTKLQEYSTINTITEMQKAEREYFCKQQSEEISVSLGEIARRLQIT